MSISTSKQVRLHVIGKCFPVQYGKNLTDLHLLSQASLSLFHMLRCLEEDEAIKSHSSTKFKTILELYYGFSWQNFLNGSNFPALSGKSGPKYSHRRIDLDVENRIIDLRKLGNNSYEIVRILAEDAITVCATTVYNICKKHGLNKLTTPIKQHRSKIIMHRAGELVHIDLYQLPKGITIADAHKQLYILGVIYWLHAPCFVRTTTGYFMRKSFYICFINIILIIVFLWLFYSWT